MKEEFYDDLVFAFVGRIIEYDFEWYYVMIMEWNAHDMLICV